MVQVRAGSFISQHFELAIMQARASVAFTNSVECPRLRTAYYADYVLSHLGFYTGSLICRCLDTSIIFGLAQYINSRIDRLRQRRPGHIHAIAQLEPVWHLRCLRILTQLGLKLIRSAACSALTSPGYPCASMAPIDLLQHSRLVKRVSPSDRLLDEVRHGRLALQGIDALCPLVTLRQQRPASGPSASCSLRAPLRPGPKCAWWPSHCARSMSIWRPRRAPLLCRSSSWATTSGRAPAT